MPESGIVERLTKRQFLKRAALVTGGLAAGSLLAACGGAPVATPAPTTAPAPTAAQAKPAEAAKPAVTTAPSAAASPTAAGKPTEAAKPTAAAKPAGSKESVTLRFHMRTGGEKSEPAIYVTRPDEWAQETGHKYKLEPIPGGKDYVPKVEALAASNTIGDLLYVIGVSGDYHHLVKYKVLEPVDDYLAAHNVKKTDWFPAIISSITIDGKVYGMPKAGHPISSFVWVNLKMFDGAGIKRPEPFGATFEDIVSWANKLAKGPKDRREVYGYFPHMDNLQPITTAMRAFGGDVVDKDGVTSLADTQPWWDWATWHNQLINVDKVSPTADVIGSGGVQALFAAEKLAMFQQERSNQRGTQLAVKDKFPWMVISYPRKANARGWAPNVSTHSGTAASRYKEVTFTLLKALSDQRFAQLCAKEQSYLTGRVDNLEVIGDLAKDPFLQLQQKNTEQTETMWLAKNLRYYEVETAIMNHMDLLWLGKRQLDKGFMAELKKTVDDVLAKPA